MRKLKCVRAFYCSTAVSALLAATTLTCGGARACEGCFDDWFAPYFQRYDSVTMSAGNGKNQNAISEIINPSPPYVHDRRLPTGGSRAASAMERYNRDAPKTYGFTRPHAPFGASATPPPPLSLGNSSNQPGGSQ